MDLDKFGDGILMPIEVTSQDTNFGLGLEPTGKEIKAMISQRR